MSGEMLTAETEATATLRSHDIKLFRLSGLSKGLMAWQGVLQGASAELRQLAAEGLGELVEATSTETLRPFVVQITGPLIRIVGDRFPWEIKAAILATLGGLLQKSGVALKPFVPQLQTTFLKCLPDQVRPFLLFLSFSGCFQWRWPLLPFP